MCSEPDQLKGKKRRIRNNTEKEPTKSVSLLALSLPHKKVRNYAVNTICTVKETSKMIRNKKNIIWHYGFSVKIERNRLPTL
jgi:hypothetical protein